MKNELVASLRGEGKHVGGGSLTLDRARAREKLRQFQLPDPHQYVLQFVRCASLAGATKVSFVIDADEVECIFDAALDLEGLADLWDRGIGERADPLNALALGIGAATALGPAVVTIQTMHAGREARFRVIGEEETYELVPVDDPDDSTRIYVREKFKLSHVLQFFAAVPGGHPESRILIDRCAWSPLEISVDGRSISRGGARGGNDYGEVLLDGGTHSALVIHCLKDGVGIHQHVEPVRIRGGSGRVVARAFSTDLTHLSVIQDDAYRNLISERGLGAYYRALIEWLPQTTPAEARALFYEALLRSSEPREGVPAPSEVAELISRLRKKPIWARGCAGIHGSIAFDDAVRKVDGKLCFGWVDESQSLHLEGTSPVVFLDDESVPRVTPREFVTVVKRALDIDHRLLNVDFEREEKRQANYARWSLRPVNERPRSPLRVWVSAGKRTAYAYFDSTLLGGAPAITSLLVEGRLLDTRVETSGLTHLWFDGEIEPDDIYDSYAPAERDNFVQLTRVVATKTLELLQMAAEQWKVDSAPGTTAFVFRWLDALTAGEVESRLLAQAGLLARSRFVPPETDRSDPVSRFADLAASPDDATEEMLELLGPVATLPIVRTAAGTRSLQDLGQAAELYWFDDDTNWSVMSDEAAARWKWPREAIVAVDDLQRSTLRRIFHARWVDGREKDRVNRLEESFLTRPLYSLPETPAMAERVFELRGAKITGRLLPSKGISQHLYTWVYRGRLLGTRHENVDGPFCHFIIESDALTPNHDWTDVASSGIYPHVIAACRRTYPDRLGATYVSSLAETREHPAEPAEFLTHYETVEHLLVHSDLGDEAPVLPVFRPDGEAYRPDYASLAELEEIATTDGRLAITRGETPNSHEPTDAPLIVNVGPGNGTDEILQRLVACELVDRSPIPDAVQRERAAAYLRRPTAPFVVPETLGFAEIETDDMLVLVGLETALPDFADGAIELSVHTVQRELETIEIAVPAGRFRGVARGSGLQPDLTYTGLAKGRDAVVKRAIEAADEAIVTACRNWTPEGDRRMRITLLVLLSHYAAEEAPSRVGTALRNTPLFCTPSGRWLSLLEVERDIADDGIIRYVKEENDPRRALLVHDADRQAHRSALVGWSLFPFPFVADGPDKAESRSQDDVVILAPVSVQDLPEEVAAGPARPPTTIQPSASSLLDDLRALLAPAAGPSVRLGWGDIDGLCVVDVDDVRLNRKHPLIVRSEKNADDGVLHYFVASLLLTAINAELAAVTDSHERLRQEHLLRQMKARRGRG